MKKLYISRGLVLTIYFTLFVADYALGEPTPSAPTYQPVKTLTFKKLGLEAVISHENSTPIVLNKMIRLLVEFKPITEAIEEVKFDARMPEHNHGMVVKPHVLQQARNSYRILGVKLHMPGKWELALSAKSKKMTEEVSFDLVL